MRSPEIRRITAAAVLGHGHGEVWFERLKENHRESALGAGYMRPPRGHRTHLKWHRTMATGRWL